MLILKYNFKTFTNSAYGAHYRYITQASSTRSQTITIIILLKSTKTLGKYDQLNRLIH